MVASDKVSVTVYSRIGNQWINKDYTSLEDTIPLPFFDTNLPVKKLYRGLPFK